MIRAVALAFIVSFLLSALPMRAEVLPSGTKLIVRLDREVDPTSKKQQQFSASVAFPVFANDHQVVPAGSRVEGEVRGSKKAIVLSPRHLILPDGRKVDFNASVGEIEHRKLIAQQKEGTIERKGGSTGETVKQAGEIGLTGAGIGAMTTGSLKGMGIGAAAGVAAVIIGRKIAGRNHSSTIIPAGTQLTLDLNKPASVPDNLGDMAPQEMKIPDRRDQRPILRRHDEPQGASAPAPASNLTSSL
ncbi:MAG: hypothetical protein HYX72_10215 [Acidobacteria bacterium]|nr:hypothetical protein [Acidobacteriota bacterium]